MKRFTEITTTNSMYFTKQKIVSQICIHDCNNSPLSDHISNKHIHTIPQDVNKNVIREGLKKIVLFY